MTVAPLLAVVRVGKFSKTAPTIQFRTRPARRRSCRPSREAKYEAKAAIDTFFTRVGDIASAGSVGLGHILGLTTPVFAGINVGMTPLWLWVAGQIASEHRRRTV